MSFFENPRLFTSASFYSLLLACSLNICSFILGCFLAFLLDDELSSESLDWFVASEFDDDNSEICFSSLFWLWFWVGFLSMMMIMLNLRCFWYAYLFDPVMNVILRALGICLIFGLLDFGQRFVFDRARGRLASYRLEVCLKLVCMALVLTGLRFRLQACVDTVLF